jgi:hypothetical protein
MTEKTEKPKKDKVTWGALLMAFFAAVTAVGDGVRSCNERDSDVDQAARAEVDRVKVDRNIQKTSKAAFEDIYARIEELEVITEEQDRDLFECRVANEAQDRLLMSYAGVSAEVQEMVTLEALTAEAKEEDHYVELMPPDELFANFPPPEELIKEEASKIAKKRKSSTTRLDKPKPKFEFEEPAPQYEQAQQQMKLPPLPPLPKLKK